MVSQATIQAATNRGLAKVASAVGVSCSWYRPSGTGAAIVSGNLQGTLNVAFDTSPTLAMNRPRDRQKPEGWYAACDLTNIAIGDYLVSPTDTFFVTALDPFRPARLVQCNQTIFVGRPSGSAPGSTYYGGAIASHLTALLTGWPASVVQGTKGNQSEVQIPGDTREAWVSILLPLAGIEILPADWVITSEATPMQYTVSARERTSLGWRLTAATASA